MNVKKMWLFAVCAAVLLGTSGCDNTVESSYPRNLNGYWASKPDATNSWYALEVGGDSTLRHTHKRTSPLYPMQAVWTHYINGRLDGTDKMELLYYPSEGNGSLHGQGVQLPLQAQNDTVIVVSVAAGDVMLYRGVKPVIPECGSLEGCWRERQSVQGQKDCMSMLVYAPDDSDVMPITIYGEESMGIGAKITNYDAFTGEGVIHISIEGETEDVPLVVHGDSMVVNEEVVFVREVAVQDYGLRMEGTWQASVMGMVSLTAVVQQDNTCLLTYVLPADMAERAGLSSTGTVSGVTYYSCYAGRGAFELDGNNEGLGGDTVSVAGYSVVFEAVSASEVKVPMNMNGAKVPLLFKKQE